MPTHPKSAQPKKRLTKCRLTGTDGNVFAVIGAVSRALSRDGKGGLYKEFVRRAMESHSYDEVIRLCFTYVDVD